MKPLPEYVYLQTDLETFRYFRDLRVAAYETGENLQFRGPIRFYDTIEAAMRMATGPAEVSLNMDPERYFVRPRDFRRRHVKPGVWELRQVPRDLLFLPCSGCLRDQDDPMYMVHDHVWESAGLTGSEVMHQKCLTLRLGRDLDLSDFTECPVNVEGGFIPEYPGYEDYRKLFHPV